MVCQRIAKDPMGMMRRDKLCELAYTRKDASQDARKGKLRRHMCKHICVLLASASTRDL